MRDLLKRFTLAFGSNKYMRESTHCGFGSVLLSCILAAVFLFFGIFTGKHALFGADYGGASDFKDFIYGAFTDGADLVLNIDASDGKADVSVGGERVTINTLAKSDDAERYSANGYSLIVDYHDMTAAYDDFTVVCVPTGGGERIDYESYLALTAAERSRYKLEVTYSGRVKDIGETDISEYERYLADAPSAVDEYLKIKESYVSDRDQYASELYKLFIKTYYPDMQSIAGEPVPTLKKYYYDLIAAANGKYLCIFGDMFIASFVNDIGKSVSFGCVYAKDAKLGGGHASIEKAQAALDRFIKDLYYGNLSTLLFFEILNCLFVILFTELIIMVAALIFFAVCKRVNIVACSGFSGSMKAVGSYAHVAALIAAVAAILFGFVRGGIADTIFAYCAFAVCISVRAAVFLVCECKRQKSFDADGSIGDGGDM